MVVVYEWGENKKIEGAVTSTLKFLYLERN